MASAYPKENILLQCIQKFRHVNACHVFFQCIYISGGSLRELDYSWKNSNVIKVDRRPFVATEDVEFVATLVVQTGNGTYGPMDYGWYVLQSMNHKLVSMRHTDQKNKFKQINDILEFLTAETKHCLTCYKNWELIETRSPRRLFPLGSFKQRTVEKRPNIGRDAVERDPAASWFALPCGLSAASGGPSIFLGCYGEVVVRSRKISRMKLCLRIIVITCYYMLLHVITDVYIQIIYTYMYIYAGFQYSFFDCKTGIKNRTCQWTSL